MNNVETSLVTAPDLKMEEDSLNAYPATPEENIEGQDWTNQQGVRFTNTESEGMFYYICKLFIYFKINYICI